MTNYRVITWTDERERPVKQMGFHVSDLESVLNLPFPKGAVSRDPITEFTGIPVELPFYQDKSPLMVYGTQFQEEINQGLRNCQVIAVDDATGEYLYDYEMPAGRTFIRNHKGKPVSKLSNRWKRIIEE